MCNKDQQRHFLCINGAIIHPSYALLSYFLLFEYPHISNWESDRPSRPSSVSKTCRTVRKVALTNLVYPVTISLYNGYISLETLYFGDIM